MKIKYNILEISLMLLCILIICSMLLKDNAQKASVLIADDWVLLRTAAINLDNERLRQGNMDFISSTKKIISTNIHGAYVVQEGWRLTLYVRPKVNKFLGNVVHNVSLIPMITDGSVTWSCVHLNKKKNGDTPPNTKWLDSNIPQQLLPWSCR